MVQILISSADMKALSELITVLEEDGVKIILAESCKEVIEKIKTKKCDLIITDENLMDIKGLECIEKLVMINPFLNCAAVSSLSHKAFHEASEGLGILMQIPVNPKKKDAKKVLKHLMEILTLTNFKGD